MPDKRLTLIKQTASSAINLLRYSPSLIRELEQARQDLVRERERSRRDKQQLREQRQKLNRQKERKNQELDARKQKLDARRQKLNVRQQELKVQRLQFKRAIRNYLLQRMPERSVCAEIGVYEGEFSRQILEVAEPELLHLIDPWEHSDEHPESLFGGLGPKGQTSMDDRYEQVRAEFAEEIKAGRVKMHRDLSAPASEKFEDSYFDWIYIDGNHLYEFVEQDLELYYPKIKPGGYIAGDDYGAEGWWGNGVQKAVDDFVSRRPGLTLEVVQNQFIIKVS